MKKDSHMKWSWILMITFLLLSILDFRFGLLGFLCMLAPLYQVFKGNGKKHCSHYCPRGSLLGKFMKPVSLNRTMPRWMLTKKFKNLLLTLMLSVFTLSMIHTSGDILKIAFSVFRFMTVSLIIGMLMGVFFKPRSWCAVCPMGHGSVLIDQQLKKRKKS